MSLFNKICVLTQNLNTFRPLPWRIYWNFNFIFYLATSDLNYTCIPIYFIMGILYINYITYTHWIKIITTGSKHSLSPNIIFNTVHKLVLIYTHSWTLILLLTLQGFFILSSSYFRLLCKCYFAPKAFPHHYSEVALFLTFQCVHSLPFIKLSS